MDKHEVVLLVVVVLVAVVSVLVIVRSFIVVTLPHPSPCHLQGGSGGR